jgi:hypothetical protein
MTGIACSSMYGVAPLRKWHSSTEITAPTQSVLLQQHADWLNYPDDQQPRGNISRSRVFPQNLVPVDHIWTNF